MAEYEHDSDRRAEYGEDTLRAACRGNSIAEIRMDGLDQARSLFGPEAVLQIEEVRDVWSRPALGLLADRPRFSATVVVRRTDDGPMWIPPVTEDGGA